ncbi:AbrB/MazE/SpoVT family DNA-binding domain-containing protein [bacterium]|nr:AbrB/MazE/SpoVT family DNA-binding domain-containing protein [bacterium]
MNPATTKMSSRGQVVIPEEIRKRLGLDAGTRFVVIGEGDVVILKIINSPSMDQFDGLVSKARKQAKDAGLRESDVAEAVRKVKGRS